MMKTRRCKICFEEKPIEKFKHWKNKDGDICYGYQCRACEERKYRHKKEVENGAMYHLARYTDKELIFELNMRGYGIENI